MSDTPNKFYLTTPIYYVNARPHIGHAYTTIAADVIARRHRLLGDDTFFLTGTDEHGQKIERSAAAAGIPPQQFADEVSASFRALWQRMGITNDAYIRTTDEKHKRGAQKLFSLLQKNGFIELRTYTGQYSIGEEMFVDGPPGTIGPDGKPTETVSEENYFFKLSEFQRPLIDLIESNELLIQPESRRNEVLSFLRGGQAKMVDGKLTIPDTTLWEYSAAGTPYIPGALKDLSISRSSFKWGVPVPGDEKHVIYVWLDALANYMTAIGYGSEDPEEQKKFDKYWPTDLHLVGKEIIRFHCVYWPAFLMAMKPEGTTQEEWNRTMLPKQITAHGWLLFEDSKMSKSRGNIVRTETILDAFGTLCPPQQQHGPQSSPLLSSRSEAEGSAVSSDAPPTPPTKHEQDLFAADVLRYFLLREIPFGQDGSFSFDALVQRYNSDLANGYGNLVSRTLSMINKYFDSIPMKRNLVQYRDPASTAPIEAMSFEATGLPTIKMMTDVNEKLDPLYWRRWIDFDDDVARGFNFSSSIDFITEHIASVDRYLTAQAPWKLASDTSKRTKLNEVLYTAAESIRIITALLYPVIPYATAKVWAQLGLGDIEADAKAGKLKDLQWGGLKPGTKLGPLSPIFPRAPKELIQLMNDMEASNATKPEGLKSVEHSKSVVKNAGLPLINNNNDAGPHHRTEFAESPISSASATAALNPIAETLHPITAHHPEEADARPETPQIVIDDFIKIDLRVAQIVVAERIPKADKLLRLEVDLGYERRQILSGIAQWYTPEELIGRRIVVIANLAPRKMRGLESHGMLLAASHGDDGKPVLATFGEDIALGSRLR